MITASWVPPLVAVRDPRSKPVAWPGPAPAPVQTHIRSLRGAAAPTSRLRRVRAQEDETILRIGCSRPWPGAVRPPGSAGTDQVPLDSGKVGQQPAQAGLRTAPSIKTPAVAYFQSATSSLRARAMIIVLPRRPPVRLIRVRNHRVSADCG